jgi:hypothetical protein
MFDRKKDDHRTDPWHPLPEAPRPAPHPDEPRAFDPVLGGAATPAVGGEFPWTGMYETPAGPQPGPPRLAPAAPAPAPFDLRESPKPSEPELAAGVADERLQTLKRLGKKLKVPVGEPGGAETSPFDLIKGAVRGLAAPLTHPEKDDPLPAPRMTDGERDDAEAQAAERIERENLQTGIKKLVK